MEILIISKSSIFTDGLEAFFHSRFENCNVSRLKSVIELRKVDLSKFEFIFMDIEKDILDNIKFIDDEFNKANILCYDRHNNKSIFFELLKLGIDGYIVDRVEKDDLVYIIRKILNGKKYYDSELLEHVISDDCNNNYNKLRTLTYREREVLEKVMKGLSNKEISKELYITEHTIKKHITSILSKLNMKNRKELIYKVSVDVCI
ncbi:response regulator transcription factor [Clostridium sardiniense]|uniref:response regulator transcription factor n=1 Tax=Clostridium sardiniense TaxID=29369 RepID=UPI003D33A890